MHITEYTPQILENYLNSNYEMVDEDEREFNGKHAFTYKACFEDDDHSIVLWKNEETFCLLAGEKGEPLVKIYFSDSFDIEPSTFEEEEMSAIFSKLFLHANLTQKLDSQVVRAPVRKI
ncbi:MULTISPECIES: hypothetical protein [Burkholderia cepacia complex]|uniref:hypothetical protein n=1 Tax=Burkholderia cepacia complex TaxID=87882 RepID=UPI00222F6E0E|nr:MULTISPECIES: hypothetical protein [Burkholderia cepacia complex]MCW3498714.1 hypothetical protein [Burkholderia cenocepacia]MCW3506198.1 hypothetical protein [Burkholderia cenocepacia]MCW3513867.1 hypothetical protein [Burkholderia cenocepacia]MCW3529017.1 hypothetical protein [Burkholderia cenocepacia]MCW3544649.1 hypothetical protein [Burkholderia cenocepacia]